MKMDGLVCRSGWNYTENIHPRRIHHCSLELISQLGDDSGFTSSSSNNEEWETLPFRLMKS